MRNRPLDNLAAAKNSLDFKDDARYAAAASYANGFDAMGTWVSITTSEMEPEAMPLFEEHFGLPNNSGKSFIFQATDKHMSAEGALDAFAAAIAEIANKLRSYPIDVVLAGSELALPIVVRLQTKEFSVLFARDSHKAHIESYRDRIEGSPEHAASVAEMERTAAERRATEAKRERLRAKGQLYRPTEAPTPLVPQVNPNFHKRWPQ